MIKKRANSVRWPLRALASALLATTCLAGHAQANPTGASVVAGHAAFSTPSANNLSIATSTAKTIINWSSFSIGRNESVVVSQALGPSSILLNRVNAGGPVSFLLGSLTSNGRVYLINPAGIVVGAGAQITAAQLLLATQDIGDASFLAGTYNFDIAGNPGAAVVNHGAITATGGAAILAGEQVRNDGVIAARFGTVVLAGAKTFTVDFTGDGLLKFAITTPVDQLPPAARALVENSGTVSAQGGTVLLTAAAAKGVIANVINTSGIVEATSAASVNGQIVLSGAGGGTAVSGTLDASGKGAGETGGQVSVLGDSVTVAAGARIDVSGDAGGGTALVGGNFHGAGPEANAQATTLAPGATIDADALTSGNGGRVAVWSDGTTSVAGTITARGGKTRGNGGYVETSGASLRYAGITVDTSARNGTAGTWLLDPYDLTIDAAGAATLDAALANTSVTVQTSLDNASGPGIANANGSGDITVNSDVIWGSGNTLTLSAYRNVNINASIVSTGGGGTILVPGTGDQGGSAVFFSQGTPTTINTAGSSLGYAYPFGSSDTATYGQTFTAPSSGNDALSSFSLFLQTRYAGNGTLDLRGYIGTWQGSNAGTILYESVTQTMNAAGNLQMFTFAPNLTLVPGNQYVAFLSIANLPAQATTQFEMPFTGDAIPGSYVYINNGTSPSLWTAGTWTTTGCCSMANGDDTWFLANFRTTLAKSNPPPLAVINPPLNVYGGGAPFVLPMAPPPAVLVTAPSPPIPMQNLLAIGPGGGGVLTNVTGIDTGGGLFTQIVGGGGGTPEPVTQVAPVKPAPQPLPKMQATDQPLGGRGSNIFQTKGFFVPPAGVPGINEPASTSGNRSLWFASGGGDY